MMYSLFAIAFDGRGASLSAGSGGTAYRISCELRYSRTRRRNINMIQNNRILQHLRPRVRCGALGTP